MRKGFKFSVEAVDNGVIVRIIKNGLGVFKEPYSGCGQVLVFHSLDHAMTSIKELYETESNPPSETL